MADVRRVIVIFVVAILFAILVQVTIDAITPAPKYEDYCDEKARPMPARLDVESCPDVTISEELSSSCKDGRIAYKTGPNGCATEAYCETCDIELEKDREVHNLIIFIVSAIAGLIAIIVGLYLPQHKNPINEWIGSGFLLGGIFTIFVGTVRYFGDMGRFLRPVIIFAELVLIIWLAYKKLGKK